MAGFGLEMLWMAGIGIVVLVIVLALGARIASKMKNKTNSTTEPEAYQIIQNGLEGLVELGSWTDLIALTVAGVVVLVIVVRALGSIGGGSTE